MCSKKYQDVTVMLGNWNILKMEPCNLPQKLAIGFSKIMIDMVEPTVLKNHLTFYIVG